ncbi:hypothetical protein [Frankia sp. QA3]|uniref:hypothetical protein n=1 Tax=Frankia sp. QA3 TaxID=710111 RepID=UPI000269C2FA|nr:hypothetical protein [Frankia sp. QA3]EIV91181.1 hypothetical protein FraQA3DRAFT_0615 [Frankia sp. QA3]
MTRRFLAWFADHGDAGAALALALLVAVLATFDVASDHIVFSAILATLAVLAAAMLRDRAQARSVHRELTRAADDLHRIPPQLDRLDAVEDLLASSRRALEESAAMGILVGAEVPAALAEARRTADSWTFRGGTGTFIRAVTLPECVQRARAERRRLFIQLEILDPTLVGPCEQYARFRRSLELDRDRFGDAWTAERTRLESFATILAACWYRQRYTFLDIHVALSDRVTTIRYDLSPSCLVITQEDPRNPALLIRHGRFFYNCYATDIRLSFEQARPVPLDSARSLPLGEQPSVPEVRALFTALGLELPADVTDTAVESIIQKAIHAQNPYA